MKKKLWLFVAQRANPEVPAIVPTLAWLAEDAGIEFEMYLEDERDGRLFARSGSTVLGGGHFQQFNYLLAAFEVEFIFLGEPGLFNSSLALFGSMIIARGASAREIYAALAVDVESNPVIVPVEPPTSGKPDLRPYCYQDVYFRRGVGIPQGACPEEDYRDFTLRLAERWVGQAEGVAFGDPDAVISMLATLCREKRVAVFGPRRKLPSREVVASAYAEECSSAAQDVCRLAETTGNRVIIGRQTCDGDLFTWSKSGVAIKIMDPNRPPFPVVARVEHCWHNQSETIFDHEPDDATLGRWADEGKCLASLLVHSGEMAHNEAMLNLIELCMVTGLKLGVGVHAARYETCPQLWELISIPKAQGGALGLVEPVLHAGGTGVMAENACPPELLTEHCLTALQRIEKITGSAWRPRGHLPFMDSDMLTFTQTSPALYEVLETCGLEYTVSSALPGRNQILSSTANHIVLNQSTRSICTGSPYVRVSTVEDIQEKTPGPSPGWWLGVIDAPVVAFNPYVWRKGSRFMEIVEALTRGKWINVTPRVIARYAQALRCRGHIGMGPGSQNPQLEERAEPAGAGDALQRA